MNKIELSPDCKTMVVTSADGTTVTTMTSSRRYGFTTEQVELVRKYHLNPNGMTPGQKTYTRKWVIFGRVIYLHRMTGPPTWWLPRVRAYPDGRHIGVGWLRARLVVGWL